MTESHHGHDIQLTGSRVHPQSGDDGASRWHLVSNHGLVLLAVARQPRARIREIADLVGVTERACQRILNDLVDSGYIVRRRVGRRNEYRVDTDKPMVHPMVRSHQVAELVSVFGELTPAAPQSAET